MKKMVKLQGTIIGIKQKNELFNDDLLVDCGQFSFELPKHLTQAYWVGRPIEIEVKLH